jgi:hypothetical protein
MSHPVLNRVLLLDHVPDERQLDHNRRSSSFAVIAGMFTAFALLEYHLLVEHRISWDLIILIYVMGVTKIALMLWYRFRN